MIDADLELGELLRTLAADQSEWSQATFGTDAERGPIGTLKHLEKEAREAMNAPHDAEEYADCLLLVLDASRRAGMTVADLLRSAHAKMRINKLRKWPKNPDPTRPTEHIREE